MAIKDHFSNTANSIRQEINFSKLKGVPIGKVGMTGMNLFSSVNAYKENRQKGGTVLGSTLKAGATFAIMDAMNPLIGTGVQMLESVPGIVEKGMTTYSQMSRQMNSMTRFQTFGQGNEFVDTQQLATMRQSGMEMAQMSQYNLQQAMMGNEAQYMHR